MLSIARPLLLNPRIMLLDEPSQGLAPLIVREVMQVVRRMREEGLSVLLIEQNAPLSLSIADRAYILDDGKVVYSGTAAELAKDTELVNKLAGAGRKAAKARPSLRRATAAIDPRHLPRPRRGWSNFRQSTRSSKGGLHALAEIRAGRVGRDAWRSARRRAEPVKIRTAWVAPVSNWASIVLEKKDLAKHLGKSYTLEADPLRRHAADDDGDRQRRARDRQPRLFDVPAGGAERQPGRSAHHRRRIPGRRRRLCHSNEFAVLKDSPIKKVEDLKGKVDRHQRRRQRRRHRVARHAEEARPGGQARLHHHRGAVPHHEGDAEGEEGRPRALRAAVQLRSGAASRLARPLFSSKDAIGVSQFIIWAARKSFIDKNRAAMVDFMEDMLRIERWFMDPKNHNEVMQIAGKVTKAPPERFDWLFTKQDYYRNPDMLPNLDALQSNIDTDARARLHQGAARREEIHRPQPRPGGGEAPEVSVTPSRRMG